MPPVIYTEESATFWDFLASLERLSQHSVLSQSYKANNENGHKESMNTMEVPHSLSYHGAGKSYSEVLVR